MHEIFTVHATEQDEDGNDLTTAKPEVEVILSDPSLFKALKLLVCRHNKTCLPGRGFQYMVDYYIPGETEVTMIIPEKDRAIALKITDNKALKMALKNTPRSLSGNGQACNHTCCEIHKNTNIQLAVMARQADDTDLDAKNSTPMAILRASKHIP